MPNAKKIDLSLASLRNRFHYDAHSGNFYFKKDIDSCGIELSKPCGCKRSDGRIMLYLGSSQIVYANRVAWLMHHGEEPPLDMDVYHKDGDPSNNKISNLGLATRQQNIRRKRLSKRNLETGMPKSVRPVKSRRGKTFYTARISNGKQNIYLGTFSTPEEAGEAYVKAAVEMFGEFASDGFYKDGKPISIDINDAEA